MIYHAVGSGPPVVLIHGMLNSSRHWREVALRLAERHRVIAPDLIGHGDSATPRGDYSLGAHAAAIRDLLVSLDVHRATFVGHSLGGGVAMQFFWQFPERVERLALVSAAASAARSARRCAPRRCPGINGLLWAAAHPRSLAASARSPARSRRRGRREAAVQTRAIVRALRPLERPGGRKAFLETLRAVIDIRGQRVSANDRLYLLGPVPTLVAWGDRDRTIPAEHGRAAAAAIPNARFELIEGAAHFPHLERPEALADCLARFIAATEPHAIGEQELAELLATRTTRRRRHLRVA